MNKPIYKLVDSKGRVLIPKALRDMAKMEYGDIVRLGLADGKVTVRKVDIVEAGDQSPEAVEAYVRAAFKSMPDSTRLELIGELSSLLQKKERSEKQCCPWERDSLRFPRYKKRAARNVLWAALFF